VAAAVLAIAATAAAVGWLPEPGGVRAPAVVNYHPLHVIRAPFGGFVTSILVQSGSDVAAGEALLVLENRELSNEIEDMQLELQQAQHRGRSYRKDQDLPAMQVEQELVRVLRTQINDRAEQLQRATLVAPAAGIIVTRDLRSWQGKYVQEGEELLAIGDENAKQMELAIAQADIDKFLAEEGQTVTVRLRAATCPAFSCLLTGVQPRATCELPHPALAAANGGPLPVRANTAQDQEKEFELTEPYFAAELPLAEDQARRLRSGQLATVRLHKSRGTLAGFAYRRVSDWFDRRLGLNK
jgi:putative peptide zinc metalloprotease protein